MRAHKSIVAVILWAFLAASPAQSQNAPELVTGDSIDDIMRAARIFGAAAIASQADGSPLITGRIDGIPYNVHFRNCARTNVCQDINFRVGYLIKPSLELINNWNQTKRFSRAYLDSEGDAILEMDVVLTGGVSQLNISEAFVYWRLSMKQFMQHIGFE